MKEDHYKIFSFLFFLLGFVFLFDSAENITGALIGNTETFSPGFGFIAGILFIFTSLSLFVEGKYLTRNIEYFDKTNSTPCLMDKLKEKLKPIFEERRRQKKEVYISQEGWDRVLKESHVRENLISYIKAIEKITTSPSSVKVMKIGDFRLTPTKGKEKIAWRYEPGKRGAEIIYIDDLLFKKNSKCMVDEWDKKVNEGKIKPEDYTRHRPFEGF
ncbi:MAG: hypothetical protein ACOCQG_04530 [Candidatus Nanoarchaeia archaeon]